MQLFLSYSYKDSAFAHALAEKLIERGVEIWTNQEERLWGTKLIDVIGESINKAEAMAFLISEHSRNSQSIAFEVGVASAQDKPIFPILLSRNKSILPPHLKHLSFLNAKKFSLEQIADIIKHEINNIISYFISYSSKDEEFARRLYSRMRDEKLRVWFAPVDIKGGEKLYEQIEQAIQIHDRFLLILSEESMRDKWVMSEIRKARRAEVEQNRRKLFPISLVGFDAIRKWKCLDPDSGDDLAEEVRSYYIPDFSDWKNHDSFEKGFERLMRDLRAEESRQARELKS